MLQLWLQRTAVLLCEKHCTTTAVGLLIYSDGSMCIFSAGVYGQSPLLVSSSGIPTSSVQFSTGPHVGVPDQEGNWLYSFGRF